MRHVKYYRVIRVLQVEGNDRQAERVRLQLYSSGLRCEIRRVATRAAFVAALEQSWPDVLLFGGDGPQLDAAEALQVASEEAPYLPTVFALPDHDLAEVILGTILQSREIRGRRHGDAATLRAA